MRPIFRKHPKLSSAGASANRRRRAFCPQSFPDVVSLIRATAQVDFSTSHVWSPSLRAQVKRSTNQHENGLLGRSGSSQRRREQPARDRYRWGIVVINPWGITAWSHRAATQAVARPPSVLRECRIIA